MTHLAIAFGFVGRLYAIRCALDYDLSTLPAEERVFRGAGATLWNSHMAAFHLVCR